MYSLQPAETFEFLLQCGANPNAEYTDANRFLDSDNLRQVVYIAEPHLCRPLHLSAALVNVPEITLLLLTQGAEINAKNRTQSTPLFAACKANNPGIASKLIENGKSRSILLANYYCIMHNYSMIAMTNNM